MRFCFTSLSFSLSFILRVAFFCSRSTIRVCTDKSIVLVISFLSWLRIYRAIISFRSHCPLMMVKVEGGNTPLCQACDSACCVCVYLGGFACPLCLWLTLSCSYCLYSSRMSLCNFITCYFKLIICNIQYNHLRCNRGLCNGFSAGHNTTTLRMANATTVYLSFVSWQRSLHSASQV